MTSMSETVYDSSLNISELPQFTQPTTPGLSPYKDVALRRSPTKPLRSSKPVPDYDEFQALLNSDVTTTAEKELASRVVRAAEKLREWCAEIEQWGWSGSFEAQPGNGVSGRLDGDTEEQEFSGSIPMDQVEAYESWLDNVDDELTFLEVDELKEQILGIHIGRSRPSSSYSSASYATNVTLYDDFQLFATETLIHTLPHHARLKHYTKAWTARLAVLAEIPSFLRGSYQFFTILNGAYRPLQYPLGPLAEPAALRVVERHLITAQNDLRNKVGQLGKQLDRMLDTLEESDDALPEQWIDKFEADETEYSNWSYEADKKLFQLRMLETALANNHDLSAWVPPDPDAAPSNPAPVDPILADHDRGGQVDREVIDVHEVTKIIPEKSDAFPKIGTAGGALSATIHFASDSGVLAYDPGQDTKTSPELPVESMANTSDIGAFIAQPTVLTPEDTSTKNAFTRDSVLSGSQNLSVTNGAVDEPSRETAIQLPKSAEGAMPGPSNVNGEAISSLPVVADSVAPAALTDSLGAEPDASLVVADIAAPVVDKKYTAEASRVFIEPVQAPETLAGATDHVIQTKSGTDTNLFKPVDEAFDQEHATRVSGDPEEALRRLEGNAPETLEISALGLMRPGDLQEEINSLGAASSPIASDAWPSDENNAEDGNGRIESLVAADLSFLNTDPGESTNIHHFVPSFVRRASATSIESFSRDKVKTVTLSRRNSANLSRRGSTSTIASMGDSSSSFPLPPNGTSMESIKPRISFGSPLSASTQASDHDGALARPITPFYRGNNRSITSLPSSARSDASEERQVPEDSPLGRMRERVSGPKPALNWAMRKRREISVDPVLDTSGSVSSPLSDMEARSSPTPASPSPSSVKSPKSPMVPFEEQLSSVLDSLPASIRLKSSPSHNAPTITSTNRMASASQLHQTRSRASTPALSPLPTLTLAPAEETSSRRSGVNDAEIKTYNLISGKDKPIRLYIRRVGENGERIMVRVGGGWSDLGEWLRNYAEHHGRRAANEGAFEVVHMTPPVHDASIITGASNTTPRSRRTSMVGSIGSSALHGTTLPSSRSTSRAGAVSPAFVDRNTPSKLQTPILRSEEFLSATPMTGGSVQTNGSRKASSPWDEGAAGLMGPAIAKKERPLSEEKSRWVDGVVEQAKRTVGKESGKGTRRVFLKGKGIE
ncbi:hypothetical protein BLS_004320 [Venturia inaequalis]|uniref:GAR domain-containing protein n=1 Tax=Venturia inaequalis TaxID=5025 RepID=A0A8H3YVU8_VENIN|nr:hypothetical protein BLS_004320 [Venturia inaequalis]